MSSIRYRRALDIEIDVLNQFIHHSKNHWQYSADFMALFMKQWGLTPRFLQEKEVILAERENDLLGLYAFKHESGHAPELALFFINAKAIRQGIGKMVWQHALTYARNQGWQSFELIADPNAEGFYQRMGATTTGRFQSFPGRFVPMMSMNLAEQAAPKSDD